MKSKILLLMVILFSTSFYSHAQQLDPKNIDEVENRVAQFINENYDQQERLEVYNSIKEKTNIEIDKMAYAKKIVEDKLRATYFEQNPTHKAGGDSCANAGFENGAGGFTFFRHVYDNPDTPGAEFNTCNMSINTEESIQLGANNDVNSLASWVNNDSNVTQGLDPTLLAIDPSFQLSRTLSGNGAIRLNGNEINQQNPLFPSNFDLSEIITMRGNFQINSPQFVFDFAAVSQTAQGSATGKLPFFEVRLYDSQGNIVSTNCVFSDPTNCNFIDTNTPVDAGNDVFYSDWTCYALDTSTVIGQNVTIEFSVTDSGSTFDFSYVYIDNLCQTQCANSSFGSLDLNPTNEIDCDDGYPLEVCASYTAPVANDGIEGTFNTARLLLCDVTATDIPPTVISTNHTSLTNDTICFLINELDIPNIEHEYEIKLEMDFVISCANGNFTETLTDTSTNAGSDIFPVTCCEEVSCPDISINKLAVGFVIGELIFEPGDTITYAIRVTNNEPKTTCPFTFNVSDVIDTTILDESSFNSGTSNVTFSTITDAVSIDNISLASGASATYTFSFQIFEDTLAESIENCAFVDIDCLSDGTNDYESCVTTPIVQPKSIWPRTYGGDSPLNTERSSADITVDADGNVYTLGNIDPDDISNEDDDFVSNNKGYIMKHDYFGNLVWITPISQQYHSIKDKGLIKYYNNKLHVFTNMGFYLQYKDDGTFIDGSAYETGLFAPAISMNTANGNIVIAGTYSINFENDDYFIEANSDRRVGAVIKFGPTGFAGDHDYITHQTFTHNGNSGKSSIGFRDIVYAENTNRIFLSGSITGNRIFPNGQIFNTPNGDFLSFLITLKDNGTELDMTHNLHPSNLYSFIEYRNSSDKIYGLIGNRLFEIPFSVFPFSGFGETTFIDNLFEYESLATDMVINQENGDLYAVGRRTNFAEVSKVSPEGSVWNQKIDYLEPQAIAVGPLDHYFITGNYSNDTELNSGPSLDPSPIFAYGSPAHSDNIFTARFKDFGNNSIFRNQEENSKFFEKDVNAFIAYPNPSMGSITVQKTQTNTKYTTVTISVRDFSGKVVYLKEGVDSSLAKPLNLGDLNTGIYFMEILNNGQSVETHKIIIKK